MGMEVRKLIESIESNFKEYYQLLQHVDSKDRQVERHHFGFSLQEYLHTVADIQEEIVVFRLKKILHEEHPYIPEIKIDKIKRGGHYRNVPLPKVVEIFLNQRQDLIRLLSSLPTQNWERTGVLESEGHVSFKELVRRMAEKDRQIISELQHALMRHNSS